MAEKIRLDKFLSDMLVGSRAQVKTYIRAKRCCVNDKIISDPAYKVDTQADVIKMDMQTIGYKKHLYLMMNKPAGLLCATEDKKVKTVIDIVPKEFKRANLFPCGRLDKDTEGFLIISDDGEFCHNMMSPKKHVEKKYFAHISSPVDPKFIEIFKNGIKIEGGYECLSSKLEILDDNSAYITVSEGKYHQVKLMIKAAGSCVTYLKRVEIGGVKLDESLEPGMVRELTDKEIAQITYTNNW